MDEFGTLSPNDDLYQPTPGQLARNRAAGAADRPGYSRLGSALGSMLFGSGLRDARADKVYNEAAQGQVRLEDLIMKARKDRDAEIGRQGMVQKALDEGRSDIADMIRNSPDAASAGEARLREQSRGWGDKAWDVATGPEGGTNPQLELMTRMNAVRNPASAPDLTRNAGGLLTNQYRAAENQPIIETPEGKAAVKEKEQSAEAHRTQALENTARTTFIEGPQTESEKALTGQRKREGRTGGALTDGERKDLFPDDGGMVDHEKYADFQRWMYDNDLTDERKAVRLWLKLNPKKEEPPAEPVEQPSGIRSLFSGPGWGGAAAAAVSAPNDAAIAYLKKNAGDQAVRAQFRKKYGQDPDAYLKQDGASTLRQQLQAPPEE